MNDDALAGAVAHLHDEMRAVDGRIAALYNEIRVAEHAIKDLGLRRSDLIEALDAIRLVSGGAS